VSDATRGLRFHVAPGPLDLPIVRYHVALLGIGSRHVMLSLRPTDDLRDTSFEVELRGPFVLAGARIETPPEVSRSLNALIDVGIVSARTTASDGLDLELITGDHVATESGSWSLEATDGRRWEAQPAGGVGIWMSDDEVDQTAGDAPGLPPTSETPVGGAEDVLGNPGETLIEVGRGIDLPGPGLALVALDVGLSGRLSLTLEPVDSVAPPDKGELPSPDVTEAFEFFATLKVGPGTIPPDPEVFEAMQAAIARLDFELGQQVWIALDDVEPPASARRLIESLGIAAVAVHVGTDGRLEVAFEDGHRLSSPDWWVRKADGERWEGSLGRVVNRRFGGDAPDLSPIDAATLASAWLDHDRSGRGSRFWAWERASDVIRRQPSTGWLLVRCLIAGAADEGQLMSVAAGPFEDFLAQHSTALMDQVEEAARSDPRVMLALAGVWKNAIDDEDWRRIQALLSR
jgi:hypothetical protein